MRIKNLSIALGVVESPTTSVKGTVGTTAARQRPKANYSPYADLAYPTRVFWGEAHLHTSHSPDAGMVGDHLGPDEALRFARGEQISSSTGQPVRLERPYDWIMLSDHSEPRDKLARKYWQSTVAVPRLKSALGQMDNSHRASFVQHLSQTFNENRSTIPESLVASTRGNFDAAASGAPGPVSALVDQVSDHTSILQMAAQKFTAKYPGELGALANVAKTRIK